MCQINIFQISFLQLVNQCIHSNDSHNSDVVLTVHRR